LQGSISESSSLDPYHSASETNDNHVLSEYGNPIDETAGSHARSQLETMDILDEQVSHANIFFENPGTNKLLTHKVI